MNLEIFWSEELRIGNGSKSLRFFTPRLGCMEERAWGNGAAEHGGIFCHIFWNYNVQHLDSGEDLC